MAWSSCFALSFVIFFSLHFILLFLCHILSSFSFSTLPRLFLYIHNSGARTAACDKVMVRCMIYFYYGIMYQSLVVMRLFYCRFIQIRPFFSFFFSTSVAYDLSSLSFLTCTRLASLAFFFLIYSVHIIIFKKTLFTYYITWRNCVRYSNRNAMNAKTCRKLNLGWSSLRLKKRWLKKRAKCCRYIVRLLVCTVLSQCSEAERMFCKV